MTTIDKQQSVPNQGKTRRDSTVLNPNPLVRFLGKEPEQFTCADLVHFMESHAVQLLNFRYVAEDGKLKTLNFAINSRAHLIEILTVGERVDGSSLFSFMETGSSDLYVVPRYRTAFLNPFTEIPTLEVMCSFYDYRGRPLETAPEYILRKAITHFRETTRMNMLMLGELEYYVNSQKNSLFPAADQHGYHESEPFAKFENMRKEAIRLIAQCGGKVKYGHSEVGNFSNGDEAFEQHEIEFLPCEVEFAADQLILAKWILRMLAEQDQVEISFAPKITVGKAGSGLHFHMMVVKDGQNLMLDNGKLSTISRKVIAGILNMADALTAFGNTIPTSYLRLVPHQEAPTNICWGDRNRSALVRVPLGWSGTDHMIGDANPGIRETPCGRMGRQTIEFRAPDGSANIHLIMAGLITAAAHGLELPNALEIAEDLFIDHQADQNARQKPFEQLPDSCYESANRLEGKRQLFEKNGIFPSRVINHTLKMLRSYDDKELSKRLYGRESDIKKLVLQYIHTQ